MKFEDPSWVKLCATLCQFTLDTPFPLG